MTTKIISIAFVVALFCGCHTRKQESTQPLIQKQTILAGKSTFEILVDAKSAEENKDYQKSLSLYQQAVRHLAKNQRSGSQYKLITKKIIPRLRSKIRIMSGILGLAHHYILQFEAEEEEDLETRFWPLLSLARVYMFIHSHARALDVLYGVIKLNEMFELDEEERLNQMNADIQKKKNAQTSGCIVAPWLCQLWPAIQMRFAVYLSTPFVIERQDEDQIEPSEILEMLFNSKSFEEAQLYALSHDDDLMFDLGIEVINYGIDHDKPKISIDMITLLIIRLQLMKPVHRQEFLHDLYNELIYDDTLATQRNIIFHMLVSNSKHLDKDVQLSETINILAAVQGEEKEADVLPLLKSINISKDVVLDKHRAQLLSVAISYNDTPNVNLLYSQMKDKEKHIKSVLRYVRYQIKNDLKINVADIENFKPHHQQLVWGWIAIRYLMRGKKSEALAFAKNIDGTLDPKQSRQRNHWAFFKSLLKTLKELKLEKTYQKQVNILFACLENDTHFHKRTATRALLDHALEHPDKNLYKRLLASIATITKNNPSHMAITLRGIASTMIKHNKRDDLFGILKQATLPHKFRLSILRGILRTLAKNKTNHPIWTREALALVSTNFNKTPYQYGVIDAVLKACHPKKYNCLQFADNKIFNNLDRFKRGYLRRIRYAVKLAENGHYDLAIAQIQRAKVNPEMVRESLVEHWIKTPKMQKAKPQFLAQSKQQVKQMSTKIQTSFHITLWESYIESGQCSKLRALPARDDFFEHNNHWGSHSFAVPCVLQNEHAFVLEMLINHVKDPEFQVDRLLKVGAYFDGSGLSQTPAIQKQLQRVADGIK